MKLITKKLNPKQAGLIKPIVKRIQGINATLNTLGQDLDSCNKELWKQLERMFGYVQESEGTASINFKTLTITYPQVEEIDREIEKFKNLKESAIKRQDFEKAAEYRALERDLKIKRNNGETK